MKKGNKVFKIFGIIFGILIIGLVILYFSISSIVLKQVNKQLPNNLNADASLGSVKLNLFSGYASIGDLLIGQPAGFGDTPLVRAGKAEVKLSLGSLKSDCIVVNRIILDDAEVNIVKNKEGKLNVEALPKAKPDAEKPAPAKPAEPMAVLLEKIELKGVDISYSDASIGKKGFNIAITNLNATVADLLMDPAAIDNQENAATVELTTFLKQGKFPSSSIGVFATVGPIINTNIPSVNAAVRVVDLELTPLGVTFPTLKETLGGDALDIHADAHVGQDVLACYVEAIMDSGQKHKAEVTGTPQAPIFDKNQVLGLVFGRIRGGLGNTVGNIASTGVGAVTAVAGTATDAAKDAGKTVGALGKGLFKTVKSVATLDVVGAASNLTQTAVGAVGDAAGTVTNAAGNLATGVEGAANTAVGNTTSTAFRKEAPDRTKTSFTAAKTWLNEQPFPPQAPAKSE